MEPDNFTFRVNTPFNDDVTFNVYDELIPTTPDGSF